MEAEVSPSRNPERRGRRFVIVDREDDTIVLDHLTEHEWSPAIIAYVDRLRRGDYSRRVSLRELRPSEMTQ